MKKSKDIMRKKERLGDEERKPLDLVPAPAVRLMKRRVLSRPGVNSLITSSSFPKSLKLVLIMNEKMSKRRIQITDLQKE